MPHSATPHTAPANPAPPAAEANGTSTAGAPSLPERLLWDLAEAAHALGLSTRTVKRMAAAGELPGVIRLGRRRMFSRRALEAWVAEGAPPLRRPVGRCTR